MRAHPIRAAARLIPLALVLLFGCAEFPDDEVSDAAHLGPGGSGGEVTGGEVTGGDPAPPPGDDNDGQDPGLDDSGAPDPEPNAPDPMNPPPPPPPGDPDPDPPPANPPAPGPDPEPQGPVNVRFDMTTGQLTVGNPASGGLDVTFPPEATADLTGTWDAATGALDAAFTFRSFAIEIDTGIIGTIPGELGINASRVTGRVPADGSPGVLNTSLTTIVGILEINATCSIGPIDMALSATLNGGNLTLTQNGFPVPAAVGDAVCGTANTNIGLPTNTSSLRLVFSRGS